MSRLSLIALSLVTATAIAQGQPAAVVARFGSLTAKDVDVDRDGLLDRLDVIAQLEVLVPGRYQLKFTVRKGARLLMHGLDSVALGSGPGAITTSIQAREIRKWNEPGPWTITGVEIRRPDGNEFGSLVAVPPGLKFQTPAYPLARWSH